MRGPSLTRWAVVAAWVGGVAGVAGAACSSKAPIHDSGAANGSGSASASVRRSWPSPGGTIVSTSASTPDASAASFGPFSEPTGPQLIVSGPNAYWDTTATLTRSTGGAPLVTVDPHTTYQRWDGWGGTFNEKGWDALSVVPDQITTALRLLFDPNDGLDFTYGRLPVAGDDYAMSWYTYDDTPDDITMANFSIARDQQMLIPYIEAALAVRPDIHLWASPWNPPSWMRDSSGNVMTDAQTLQAYALYIARFVEEYAKIGLTIEAIHPQNEPGYAWAKWPGNLYDEFIKTYLGPTFAQRNLTAQIWCGTMSAPSDEAIATTVAGDPDAMKYVKGFGVQWNVQSLVGTLAMTGLPVMQTEHKCGNYHFTTTYWDPSWFNPNTAPNDHEYGEESWKLIRDWMDAGVNSYSAWNMVLDTIGKSLTGWPQNALLVVDRNAKTLIATPAYYVFRHFAYVVPGATRLGVSGSNDAVAFVNPDGRIVTEVYNEGDASETMTVGIAGAVYEFELPGHGWATLRVMP